MDMQDGRKHPGLVVLRQGAGYASVAAGVAGCILPVIPGIPLLFVGLGLLAVDSPWAARLRDRLKDAVARRLLRERGRKAKSQNPAI
jgi:uncharacterized protein